jgi:hypothetical protein
MRHRFRSLTVVVSCALLFSACGPSGGADDGGMHDASAADAARLDAASIDASADAAAAIDAATPADAAEVPDASVPPDAYVPPAPIYCGHPADCAPGSTCAADGTCQPGDCTATPCIFGYACAAGTCTAMAANACDRDSECVTGACIDGVCAPAADFCFDASQCAAGDHCVSGKCMQGCTSSADCSGGYGCDTTLGVCSVPLRTCTITNDCGGPSTVCVAGACVPRSLGGACMAGQTWVENGCVRTQGFTPVCVTTGVRDACATGSICLHHTCFLSCAAPSSTRCASETVLNQCRPVTAAGTEYDVCGTPTTLGHDCSPPDVVSCPGVQTCVDGFCR